MKPFVVVVLLALVGGCEGDAAQTPDAGTGKPRLVLDKSMFDFGDVATGSTSPPASFSLHNDGQAPSGRIEFSSVGGFAASAGTCTGSLAAGDSCSFTVEFSPVATGMRLETLQIKEGAKYGPSINVQGRGVSPNQLALSKPNHDFGTMVVGAPNPTFTFNVQNFAPVTTGAISVTITGADASSFSHTTTCTTLAPNATCAVAVTAATTTGGTKAAVLQVKGLPGGVATAPLSSRLLTPAVLSMTVTPDAQFGEIVLNNTADRTFVVTNSGTQASGPLVINLSPGDFAVQTGNVADCRSGISTLSLGATCNVRVRFRPTTTGNKTATLTVSSSPGGEATATLTGAGLAPGQLVGDRTTYDFESTEVQVLSASTFTWHVTNSGQTTTGVPSLTNNNGSEFIIVSNGCTAALEPGASCSITTRFRPLDGGTNTGNLTLSASPGGSAGIALQGEGLWRLTVTTAGTGMVSSTSISCGTNGTNCTGLYAHNSTVTLIARPINGTGFQFASWSNACFGVVNDCTITMTGLRTATATFTAVANNLAFVSSASFAADLGGVAAYDDACNTLATAAGINDVAGTAFKAWISDDTADAVTRLGATTGGWVTINKRIFARSMNDLVNHRVLNPITVDENGAAVTALFLWTATKPDGTVSENHCSNWSSTTGTADVGIAGDGPGLWTTAGSVNSCALKRRVYCLQTTSTTPIPTTLPPPEAKIIYYTDGFTPGGGVGSANAHCNAHKPAIYATRTFRALVATSTQRIKDVAGVSTTYYRPDGTLVGTGANLSGGSLQSGIWQRDDGTYPPQLVRAWSGSTAPNSFGSVTSSCNDWTYNDPGATGIEGLVNRLQSAVWWTVTPAISCNSTRALYCIEQ